MTLVVSSRNVTNFVVKVIFYSKKSKAVVKKFTYLTFVLRKKKINQKSVGRMFRFCILTNNIIIT